MIVLRLVLRIICILHQWYSNQQVSSLKKKVYCFKMYKKMKHQYQDTYEYDWPYGHIITSFVKIKLMERAPEMT